MRPSASSVFRRSCLALALLASTWSLPREGRADAYGLQTVKDIADRLKPNVLVVLETAESMQGLPGENPARYNEVGADCEDGNRSCRLVGQTGRWSFSGMGSHGMYFGKPPATCTETYTDTTTYTATQTQTDSSTRTDTSTATRTASDTDTHTGTETRTQTATETRTDTQTGTGTKTQTATQTQTETKTSTSTKTETQIQTSTETSTATATGSQTASTSQTQTETGTGTRTQTATETVTSTETSTSTYSQTGTQTASGSSTSTGTQTGTTTTTYTSSSTYTSSQLGTNVVTDTIGSYTLSGTVTATNTAYVDWASYPHSSITTRTVLGTRTQSGTGTRNITITVTSPYNATETKTTSGSATGTGNAGPATATWVRTASDTTSDVGTASGTFTVTGVGSNTAGALTWTHYPTNTITQSQTLTSTLTNIKTNTVTLTNTFPETRTTTQTLTQTNTATPTRTNTLTQTVPATVTNTVTTTSTTTQATTVTNTNTLTNSKTITQTTTPTATDTVTNTPTVTNTSTITTTDTLTNTPTITNTSTATALLTITVTNTVTVTQTDTLTDTNTILATVTNTSTVTLTRNVCVSGNTDPAPCNTSTPTDNGFCNETDALCTADSACSSIKGDFCRYIATSDGSGRRRVEACIDTGTWGSCKHGVVTANTTCASGADSSCATALPGDFCAEGLPARMCADTGIWCRDGADCTSGSTTDTCSPATSRMMTVKRALRRAMTEYSDKVSFGFMSTYQGRGVPATAANASTAIFPYVKLQSCSGTTITETKLLTRGELERAGCFDLQTGPVSPCTVDYGGNGAINTDGALNKITYTIVASNDSRWAIPRGDGSGKVSHVDASWSTCSGSAMLPACAFSAQGTGLYEGSYYAFTYTKGTPIPNAGVDGEGSMAHPIYFTTYKGKFFGNGSVCYNAMDAERTDIVNDGIYGRPAYTGHPYSSANEIPVPWAGASNVTACDAATGAIWNADVVPFLTDTTFGGKSITRDQKILMTTARLEKASFGGVHATGRVAPIACSLKNDGLPDKFHSAADYMSTVKSEDVTSNGGKPPCWSNNIILVVDGQPNGPGDMDGSIDCASAQCAYSATNTTLGGCNCPAIMKAYNLAHSGSPVQTHVVVNAPPTWSVRYPYTYAFLTNLAIAGSPGFDGTPSFGTSEDEVYKGIMDKIEAAAYHFPYATTTPVAGATTQNPDSQVIWLSSYLYDTSVSYPSWKGTVRAFDTASGAQLVWDAATVAKNGHPATWRDRRILFSKRNGTVTRVLIDPNNGHITNAADLYQAGLGASSTEAELIMQWLLGKPELANPTPLMGSISSSTPIVVGQAGSNGLNGSAAYMRNTWRRPELVYVGSDDGMLHAFFAHAGTKSWAGVSYEGGEEAFAYIPNDMLPVITKLYAQGGQKLPVDRNQHIFGLASSAKVKDMCIGNGCETDQDGSGWHTVLLMTEGPGGNKPFALDITHVVDANLGLQPNNLSLLWSAANGSSDWDRALGETTSIPAFYFAGYGTNQGNRVLLASGYPTKTGTGYDKQGLWIVNADAASGAIIEKHDISQSPGSVSDCDQKRTILADIAVARYYTLPSSSYYLSQSLMAAYTADTWGNVYQYVPGSAPTRLFAVGTDHASSGSCSQPIHFGPAVVQLDRAPKAHSSANGYIYLVHATNSNQDPATRGYSTAYPGSRIVVTKLDGNSGAPQLVSSYDAAHNSAHIVLSTDPSTVGTNRICVQGVDATTGAFNTFTDNAKKWSQTCAEAGGVPLTEWARPVGTPTAVLRADGLGFQVVTTWYDVSAMQNDCSTGKQFNYGKSYITVHEFGADGTWYQIAGVGIDNTVLTGIAFIGTGLFADGINAGSVPQGISIGESFSSMQQLLNTNGAGDRYLRTTWTERM